MSIDTKEIVEIEKEVVEIDETLKDAIADKIKSGLVDEIKETVENTVKESLMAATEKTLKKNLSEGEGTDEGAGEGAEEVVQEKGEEVKESAALRFMKATVALANGDYSTLSKYNKIANERRSKAGYGNIGTGADGAFLVSDPDFDTEVSRLEKEYGIAFQYADVRRINGKSVKLNKKSSGFELTETSEHTAITGGKLSIGQVTADLRKFAGIVPATSELDEDSAVDYWQEVTNEFALARAKKADQLVFTDTTSGILKTSGVAAHAAGTAITNLDWDDLMTAQSKIVAAARGNANWFMNYTVWNQLNQLKAASDGHYLFQPNPDNLTTPWGRRVIDTEILPEYGDITGNESFAVFGDLKRYRLYVKNGIRLEILREGTVTDADGVTFNLATQDGKALRGVTRMLGVMKFAKAFCIVGIGTVS